jgi:hypothetical protein
MHARRLTVALVAAATAATAGAATNSAGRPLLTYAVAPMHVGGGWLSLGTCATDLQGHTFHDVSIIGRPTWSPDGGRLAYIESSNGIDGSLGAVRAGGTDARLLTNGVIDTPQWSPDGSLIAFTQGPQRAPRVAVIKPDGSGEQEVATAFDPVWRVPAPLPSHAGLALSTGLHGRTSSMAPAGAM